MAAGEPVAAWSSAARGDVDAIWDYYADQVSDEMANKLVRAIQAAASRVAKLPLTGRSRFLLLPDLRSVRAPPYLVFYRLGSAGVEVVRVLHEHRDLEAAFAGVAW